MAACGVAAPLTSWYAPHDSAPNTAEETSSAAAEPLSVQTTARFFGEVSRVGNAGSSDGCCAGRSVVRPSASLLRVPATGATAADAGLLSRQVCISATRRSSDGFNGVSGTAPR